MGKNDTVSLKERLMQLEEANRFTLDALDAAASLGDFQSTINKLLEPSVILAETRKRICNLIPFQATAFYLVNEETNEFVIRNAQPKNFGAFIKKEVEHLIETGTFAWALGTKSPVTVTTQQFDKKMVLHTMATSSRIRGMFIGLLDTSASLVPDISLSLLSIILLYSSNAIESFELYSMIKNINASLEKTKNYRILFETAPDGVELLGRDGRILDCNQAQQDLLGCSRDDIVGHKTVHFLSSSATETNDRIIKVLKESGYAEGETELVHSNGTLIPVWMRAKAIYDDERRFLGYVIYNRNLTDLKKAERERGELQLQLQRAQKMEALGTLAGGVAHDLNNILVGLVSYPELIMMQLSQNSPLRKPVETIKKSGEKASAIVQDLLTLARRGVAPTEIVNLNSIIAEYFGSPEFERIKINHPGVHFTTDLASELLNINGSPVHLSKTVANLISNAVEAMNDGGRIFISTKNQHISRPISGYDTVEKGVYSILRIRDEGIGIPDHHLDRIFEPFYSNKKMGRSGTGLGLAVVWGTTKDHRGYIDVTSEEGKGTTFTLYFPATKEKSVEHRESMAVETYRGNGEIILVVDDIEEQREIAASILKTLGYTVILASSGMAALKILENTSVDLVLLDMIMEPGLDGLETYRRIKKLNPFQKAIIVSGFSETERVRQAQRLGAGTYIKKPYLIEKIGTAIKQELAC